MKTKKTSRTAGIASRVFSFREWIDFDRIRTFTLYVMGGLRRMFVPQQESIKDKGQSFRKAVEQQNLNQDDLKKRQQALLRLSMLMLFLAFCIFGYAIYQLVYGSFKAVLVSLAVTLIALVLSFRYHFWYFQIKERRLGCTINEWYRKSFKR